MINHWLNFIIFLSWYILKSKFKFCPQSLCLKYCKQTLILFHILFSMWMAPMSLWDGPYSFDMPGWMKKLWNELRSFLQYFHRSELERHFDFNLISRWNRSVITLSQWFITLLHNFCKTKCACYPVHSTCGGGITPWHVTQASLHVMFSYLGLTHVIRK